MKILGTLTLLRVSAQQPKGKQLFLHPLVLKTEFLIVICLKDGTVRIWNLETFVEQKCIECFGNGVMSAWMRNGIILSAQCDGSLKVDILYAFQLTFHRHGTIAEIV